ncbi:MAG: tagatose 1,6-diphosphate aldolase [Terriglobia bacterium]
MTPGKRKGLEAISDARGVIAALALDQRGSLAALMKGASGREPTPEMLREFKRAITQELTPAATAILLDLQYGSEALALRAKRTGLILTYENDAYLNRSPHRMPQLIPGMSVARLKNAGADCVKLLIHYTPDAPPEVNAAKQALVEKVGAECSAEDVAFLLEVVGYDSGGRGEQEFEYALKKPRIVAENTAEFTQARYGVDVLKIEMPVNLRFTSGTQSFKGTSAYSRDEALDFFRQAASCSLKPFIYLSAGVCHAEFVEGLALAAAAGVSYSGVLCGRAIWQDGARVYACQGRTALGGWIESQGREYLQTILQRLESAHPWTWRSAAEPQSRPASS